jgi:hypothetical protein
MNFNGINWIITKQSNYIITYKKNMEVQLWKKRKCNKKINLNGILNGNIQTKFLNDTKDYIIIESKKIKLALWILLKNSRKRIKNRMIELFCRNKWK